ncbi:EAL domain-containing protein [Chelatococcus sambhunathii]|uniref:EAL domain-containing protein n=1 Tax=Chelatococcus sambhunathii TaxID=363953 RepID=A0ABU1DFA2_9HYPH|nr:EAL domain-containing protein [Chelatococcus sambhunathii]MDR4306782.1 EAL domain-containing protein [Chelatococcus sambhunathii]
MLSVIGCITEQHNLWLVLLAAVICALASYTAVAVLHRAQDATGSTRGAWLSLAALASGSGIWATHFVAMLAYAPGLPSGYDLNLTVLSLVVAVLLTGAALRLSLWRRLPASAWIGGGVIGLGIAAMHYLGMAAYEVAGTIRWSAALVAASILIGVAGGAAALPVALRRRSPRDEALAALLLTIAICGHHFTAMGAVAITPDPLSAIASDAAPHRWLAAIVSIPSLSIIVLALGALVFENRERRRHEREQLVRSLANAAVEGVLVCDGDRIVTANDSLAALLGRAPGSLAGASLAEVLPPLAQSAQNAHQAEEIELSDAAGDLIPVELIEHSIDLGGRPHRAVALRDLRARREAERHIHFLAHHDDLTGVANRSSFNAKFDRAIDEMRASGRGLTVLCLDLDRFKEVNDLYGHAAGDELLQTFARRIEAVLDEGQTFARLGGDEFAILAPGIDEPAAAEKFADDILEAVKKDDGAAFSGALSTSIGIALAPLHGAERETLMGRADAAMYQAKLEGRGGSRMFKSDMGSQVRARRLFDRDLRQAIACGEFQLVYQPQTTIGSGTIVGFEALLRWRHPERGDIPPAMFIPVAEDSGSIVQIGEWALQEACREAAQWTQALSVSVNVSAVQLHHLAFAKLVRDVLEQTRLSPDRLELEITETALIRDLDRALWTLRQLQALGVRIAMDDFGTGYSSLSTLRAFSFDKIKIDRSLVRSVDSNEQAAAIVRAVLGLGRGLGLPVLAEGVETTEELAFLKQECCDEAQGYLIGRPLPIEAYEHIVRLADVSRIAAPLVWRRLANAASDAA